MINKFNNYINLTICYLILAIALGIILIIYPELSITVVSYVISIGLIINGLTLIINEERTLFIDLVSIGLISLLFGVVTLIRPSLIINFIPLVVGLWMIISSVFRLRFASLLRHCNDYSWLWIMLLSALSLLSGVIIILNPTSGALAITSLFGVMMLSYSIITLLDIIVIKRNMNVISKNYRKLEKKFKE